MVEFLLTYILSNTVLAMFWLAMMFLMNWVAFRTGLYAFVVVAGACIPQALFHLYGALNLWPSTDVAILYSRIADIVIVLSLTYALRQLYFAKRRGEELE